MSRELRFIVIDFVIEVVPIQACDFWCMQCVSEPPRRQAAHARKQYSGRNRLLVLRGGSAWRVVIAHWQSLTRFGTLSYVRHVQPTRSSRMSPGQSSAARGPGEYSLGVEEVFVTRSILVSGSSRRAVPDMVPVNESRCRHAMLRGCTEGFE